jgi:excisionase family DNA binding protein
VITGRHDTYFTIQEVADMAGVCPKTVRNWIAEGVIKAVFLGRKRFVTLSSIEEAMGARVGARRPPFPATMERHLSFVREDFREKQDEEAGGEENTG